MLDRKTSPREYKYEPREVEMGEKVTIPGQASDIRDLVQSYVQGFPLPLAKEEINLNMDLREFTEDMFDFPDLEQFRRLDLTEQAQVRNNLNSFVKHITSEFGKLQKEYEQKNNAPQNEEVVSE